MSPLNRAANSLQLAQRPLQRLRRSNRSSFSVKGVRSKPKPDMPLIMLLRLPKKLSEPSVLPQK